MKERYRQTPEEIYAELNTCPDGLSGETAKKHAEQYGKNAIAEGKKTPVWMIFLEQFKDFLVIILIIAALISAFTGDLESFIVIIAVITMNAILGTVQTVKAEKSLSNLKKLSSPTAKVMRDGQTTVLPAEEVTVGDIVLLEAGDQIPADGRLIDCASLQTNESALTGESTNVEKSMDSIAAEVPLAERKNMVYSGGFVTYGRGAMVVTDIGMQTEVGKIAALIQNAEARKTPLQKALDQFGKRLSIGIMIVCVLVFVLSLIRVDGIDFQAVMDSLMFAIALAVAAIPEALSSIVTIVLSFGTQKMSQEHAIMRKLQAVEGLGSVSVICSDKTGTLTQNKMSVRKIVVEDHMIAAEDVNPENPKEQELILASVLCNDATCQEDTEIGDPTETALVRFAQTCGLSEDQMRGTNGRVDEIPFDSERKLMSTLNQCGTVRKMYTKGATDVLLDRMTCSAAEKQEIQHQVEELSEQGLRVLCFAAKPFAGDTIQAEDENGLTYLGLIAEMDPPRVESKQAVAECKSAGIKPVMITGDHIVTASAIAKEIGILERPEEAVEGAQLDAYTDEQLIDFVADKSVYARVTPEHKIRIVRAWQHRDNIVAMTGDGVNDAPALKQADVGVAMGITGTEVAKDAAAMILTDDNFATIVKAVKNGRNIYENIKKAILFLLSGNLAGIITVLFCSLAGLPVPFAPIHLLFINLLTDSLPAIALGLEPHSEDVMKCKPRPAGESILTKDFLIKTGYSGVIISLATIGAFLLGYFYQGAHNAGAAMTMAFATLCMARLFHGFSCKADKPVLFSKRLWNNKFTILAFLAGMLLINAVLWIPALHNLFQIENGMSGLLIGAIYGFSFGSMLLVQLVKAIVCAVRKSK
ncbi:cation-translocating P-type ATPase [uncultured Ruminococcus sp.]|uniref:cation-translocating P-type ATPase n=1 Tax=uncultured Ruminococcus sp. TaxID=165186 RepID=UPI0025FB62FD|nr:cation-translocating P-type ATPase [uncultured Ruminococcus sp.]